MGEPRRHESRTAAEATEIDAQQSRGRIETPSEIGHRPF